MKTLKISILVILLFFTYPVTAFGLEEDLVSDYSDEYYDILKSELPQQTIEILEESGFDSVNFESILSAENQGQYPLELRLLSRLATNICCATF